MSKKKKSDEMAGSEGKAPALPIPVLATYNEGESFGVSQEELPEVLPLIALRNIVIYPGTLVPILVGRKKSVEVIRQAEKENRCFGVIAQRDAAVEDPSLDDLYPMGTVVEVTQIIELPTGDLSAILRGRQRFELRELLQSEPYLAGRYTLVPEEERGGASEREFDALVSLIHDRLILLLEKLFPGAPAGFMDTIRALKNKAYIINLAANLIDLTIERRQEALSAVTLNDRGVLALSGLHGQIEEADIKDEILRKTRQEMDQQQREYFLQQQMRTIQEELGGGNNSEEELEELRKAGEKKSWDKAVAATFEKELRKAERLNPQSPDYSIQMQYLRTIVELPWGVYSTDNFDLKQAQETLDREHYGLERVKERILEHLAVLKLKGDMKSPILCLYGPPGVGKTSLGRSIAESLGRKYVRISLGGVHDEAEIRGHRRTYIGAMSGRIIQSLQKAGTSNPVFVLDEIDKLSSDYKGDPASALLEVLDPEQNTTFHDNYLDIDYDLSKILFIATANNLNTISQPLLDRMELIEVSGYILEEKIEIAMRHLIPKQMEAHGITKGTVRFHRNTVRAIIDSYTRESGVRSLEKKIAKIMRRLARKIASDEAVPAVLKVDHLREYLGPVEYTRDKYQDNRYAGVVTGLAWTAVGGEILFVESSLSRGKSAKLTITGNLGDVMKESAILALEYVHSHAAQLGIEESLFENWNVHIHVPEGAIPKDGPSAGITMVTSLVSTFTRRKVKSNLAMTGEITLRGKVLPVGGIKEKILAAKRAGIREIVLCEENRKDVE